MSRTALDIVTEPDLLLTKFYKSGFERDALLTVNALDSVALLITAAAVSNFRFCLRN
jgi:hypothetical protein